MKKNYWIIIGVVFCALLNTSCTSNEDSVPIQEEKIVEPVIKQTPGGIILAENQMHGSRGITGDHGDRFLIPPTIKDNSFRYYDVK